MRNDMGKVVTERPRRGGHGGGKSLKRKEQQLGLDELPNKESMTAPWRYDRKHPRARLQPLKRFLASRVGRPWNDVYSEIRRTINFNKKVLIDALDYVRVLYVETHVQLIDGEPHDMHGYRVWSGDFWVHPHTGILMPPQGRKRYRWQPRPPIFKQVPIDDLHKFVEIDGLWYLVGFEKIDETEWTEHNGVRIYNWTRHFDILLRDWPYPNTWGRGKRKFIEQWGAAIVAVSKRQVGKREIRRLIKPYLDRQAG